jgi:hypothetical protein
MERALDICARLVDGKSLTAICKLACMPRVGTVYAWLAERPEFQKLYATAKLDQADTYGSMALDVANEPVADAVAVQRNRLRVDTLKWMAGVQRPGRYGAKVAIGGAEDLPPVQIDELEGARRIAFVLARASEVLDRSKARTTVQAERPPQQIAAAGSDEPPVSWLPYLHRARAEGDAETAAIEDAESAAEMGRIGDPQRVQREPVTGRLPLSRRAGRQST